MSASHGHDDLLTPTVGSESARTSLREGERPWRLGSQGYVAFFGGPVGAAVIAYINAGRLRMDGRSKTLIALAGAVGMVAVVGLVLAVGETSSGLTVGTRALGLLAWGPMYLLQRTPDRVHHFYSGPSQEDDYDSLLGPGAAVALLFGLTQAFVVAAIANSS